MNDRIPLRERLRDRLTLAVVPKNRKVCCDNHPLSMRKKREDVED